MTTINLQTSCAACGATESLDALILRMIDDDTARRLIASVLTTSFSVGGLLVRYLRLHTPAKQRLKIKTLSALLEEVVPDIQRGHITRAGRDWPAPMDTWRAALEAVFDAQARGTLALPLQGNAYLYSVMQRMADKYEGQAEQQTEQERRHRAPERNLTITGAHSLSSALDPALAKLQQDFKTAAPMPESVRQRLAALRAKPLSQPTQE